MNFKNIILFIVLWPLSFILSVPCSIDKDLVVDVYTFQHDESAIRAMSVDVYEVEDQLKHKYASYYNSREFHHIQQQLLNAYDGIKQADPMANEGSLVLRFQGLTIGFCQFYIDSTTNHAHICMFMLDKNYRKLGYGEKFLTKILEKFQSDDQVHSVSLRAHPIANSAAINLYRKVGFSSTDVPINHHTDMIFFSKQLSESNI